MVFTCAIQWKHGVKTICCVVHAANEALRHSEHLQTALDDVVAIEVTDEAHDARLQGLDHDRHLRTTANSAEMTHVCHRLDVRRVIESLFPEGHVQD